MANIPKSYNIQFRPRSKVETYQLMASDVFAQLLPDNEWMQGMLFPEQHHAIWLAERELGKMQFDLKWVDKELNYEQQVARKFLTSDLVSW